MPDKPRKPAGPYGRRLPKAPTRKVFVQFVLSYLVLMMIAIGPLYLVYRTSVDILESEARKSSLNSLAQLRSIVDSRIRDVENIGIEVSLSKRVQNIIYQEGTFTDYQNFLLTEIISQFHNYMVVNAFIDDVSLYLPNVSLVVRSNSVYGSFDWYQSFHESESLPYMEFLQMLKGQHNREYIQLGRAGDQGTEGFSLLFLQSIPFDRNVTPYATLIISLRDNILQANLSAFDWLSDGGAVAILNSSDQVISRAGRVDLPADITHEGLAGRPASFGIDVQGREYMVTHVSSEVTDWTYVFLMPTSVFYEKLDIVRTIFAICLASFLFAGVFLTMYSIRINYSPLRKLVNLFSGLEAGARDLDEDEFRFIESCLQRLLKDRSDFQGKIESQKNAMRNVFVSDLLRGRIESRTVFQERCQEFDIPWDDGMFAVLLIDVSDRSDLFFEGRPVGTPEPLSLARFVLGNLFEEQYSKCGDAVVAELDTLLACILHRSGSDADLSPGDLVRIADECCRIASSGFGIEIHVAVSAQHASFTSLPDAYAEALEVMEYLRQVGEVPVMAYATIRKPADGNLFVNMAEDRKFRSAVEAGDFERAKEILDRICETLAEDPSGVSQISVMRFRMYALTGYILEAIHDLTARYDPSFLCAIDPEERFARCETLVQLQGEMRHILDSVSAYVRAREESKGGSLMDTIATHISQHYMDSNLNVSSLSDTFGLSVPYLSRTFKKRTGVGLLDHIQSIRIQKARELLRKGCLPIKDVAAQVGYDSTISFIRVFKKHVGMSPGRYAKQAGDGREAGR